MNRKRMLAEKAIVAPHIYAGLSFHSLEALDMDSIMDLTCRVFEVEKSNVIGNERFHTFVMARRAFSSVMYKISPVTKAQIGWYIGRDHSTVIHTLKKHDEWMEVYPLYKHKYNELLDAVHRKIGTKEKLNEQT